MAVIFTLKALDLIQHNKHIFENKLYHVPGSYKTLKNDIFQRRDCWKGRLHPKNPSLDYLIVPKKYAYDFSP